MSVNSGSTPPTRRGRPHRRASTQARRGYEEDTENEANQNNNDLVPRPNKRYKKARDRVTRRDNCRTAFGMPRGDTNEMDSIRNEIDDAHFANNAYQSYARVSGAARPRVVANAGGSTPTERLLMRSWMVQQVTLGRIPGLQWHDEERTRIRIPWVHGSRHTYGPQHSKLFRAWAEHTGRFDPHKHDPKKWKANFRCALNSLPDVVEVKGMRKKGQNAYKVYRLAERIRRRAVPSNKRGRPRTQSSTASSFHHDIQIKDSTTVQTTRTKQFIRERLSTIHPKPTCTTCSVHHQQPCAVRPACTIRSVHHQQPCAVRPAQHSAPLLVPKQEDIEYNSDVVTQRVDFRQSKHSEIPLTVELVANDVTMPLQPIAMTVNNQNSPSYEHEYYGYHNHMIQQQALEGSCTQFNQVVSPRPNYACASPDSYTSASPVSYTSASPASYTSASRDSTDSTDYTQDQYHNVMVDLLKRTEHEVIHAIVTGDACSSGYQSDTSCLDQSQGGAGYLSDASSTDQSPDVATYLTLQPARMVTCVADESYSIHTF